MTTIAYTKEWPATLNQLACIITWPALANGNDGAPVELAQYPDRSIQVAGTFGSGGSCAIEGSIDGTNWATLNDPQGNALTITAAKIEAVAELVRYLRPHVTAGDGTTALTVTLIMR